MRTVNLGTAASINISNHEELGQIYSSLTLNNFYQVISDGSGQRSSGYSATNYWGSFTAPQLSYNSSTGVITNTAGVGRYGMRGGDGERSGSFICTTTVYCVYVR